MKPNQSNLKEKWDKECKEAMKENNKCACGMETTIGGADVEIGGVCHRVKNPCYIIEMKHNQIEKETKQDINKITNRIMNWMQEFGVEMSLLGIVLPKELDDVKGVCKAIKESNGDWWRKYSEEEYKRGKRETLQEVKDKMPKELEWKSRDRCEVCINYNCGYCSNCMRTVFDHPRDMSDIDKGFNEYRSQMLEIIEKLK